MTFTEAYDRVKNLPQIKEFLNKVEDGRLECFLDQSGQKWIVRVYQVVKGDNKTPGHSATHYRYSIDKNTGVMAE